MALTEAHAALVRRSGQDVRDRLRSKLIMPQYTNREFIGDVQALDKVQIVFQDHPATGANAEDVEDAVVSRNPSWSAAMTIGSELEEMAIDQRYDKVVALGIDDITDAPFSMMQAANELISRRLAYNVDRNLAKAFIAGAQAANVQATGDGTDYVAVNADGTPNVAGVGDKVVIDAFIKAAQWIIAQDLDPSTAENPVPVWCICPSYLWSTWLNYIERTKPTDALFNTFIALGSRQVTGNDVQVQQGVPVQLYKHMPTATVSSKVHGQILFGTNRVMAFGSKAPVTAIDPPTSGTTGPIGWSTGTYIRFGRKVINPEQLRIAQIRAEA